MSANPNPSTEPVAWMFQDSERNVVHLTPRQDVGLTGTPLVPQSVALHYKSLAVELARALRGFWDGPNESWRIAQALRALNKSETSALLNETNETEKQG